MENQDDPRRPSKEVCTSASRIKVHKHIKKVESASNIRAHGGNILTQPVPLQRLPSMPIIPKRSGVPCAENVPPFAERPICMPKPDSLSGPLLVSFFSITLNRSSWRRKPMTTAAPHYEHGYTTEATLFVAFELSEKTWKLGFTTGHGQKPQTASSLDAKAKVRFKSLYAPSRRVI